MGGELVNRLPVSEGETAKADSPLHYPKFHEVEGYYIALGMTYEQFWDGDATMVLAYRKAHEIKKDLDNERAWLQGMYIYEALCDVSPLFNMNSKRGTKAHPYRTSPYEFKKPVVTVEDETNEQKEQMNKMLEKMNVFARLHNKKFAERGGEKNG